MKRKSKTERAKLVDKLDAVVRRIVFATNPHYCVCCGKMDTLQLGHIFSRVTYSTRWDVVDGGNCTIQCAGCNALHEHDTVPLFRWFISKYSQENFDLLYARYKTVRPIKTFELKQMLEVLEEAERLAQNIS